MLIFYVVRFDFHFFSIFNLILNKYLTFSNFFIQQRPLLRGSSIQNSLAMNYPQISPHILNWTQQQNPWMMDPSNAMRVVYPVSYPSPSPVTAMPVNNFFFKYLFLKIGSLIYKQ